MKVILIVVFSITIIKILPPLASVLRSPKVTGPGYRTSVLQLGPIFVILNINAIGMKPVFTYLTFNPLLINVYT